MFTKHELAMIYEALIEVKPNAQDLIGKIYRLILIN